MSEIQLQINAVPTIKVVRKTIQPRRGVGSTRLILTFEVSTKQQAAIGYPAWITDWCC